MILVVDVGNTNITFGVFDGDKLATSFRMMSKIEHTSDEYGMMIKSLILSNNIALEDIHGAIIASVVPKVMHALTGALTRYLNVKPIVVGPGTKTGIKITTENPREIGADRIAAAIGASSLRLHQGFQSCLCILTIQAVLPYLR